MRTEMARTTLEWDAGGDFVTALSVYASTASATTVPNHVAADVERIWRLARLAQQLAHDVRLVDGTRVLVGATQFDVSYDVYTLRIAYGLAGSDSSDRATLAIGWGRRSRRYELECSATSPHVLVQANLQASLNQGDRLVSVLQVGRSRTGVGEEGEEGGGGRGDGGGS